MLWVCGPVRAQVFVEDSPAAAELFRSAEDRLAKDEPEDAAKLVQKLLDEHGSRLLELEPGRYSEVRRVVAHRLTEQPALLAAYRALYEPQASQLFQQAGHDRKALGDVFRRYGMTDAGLEAALRLVGLDLESGEAEGAAVVLTQVRDHPSLELHRELWLRLKAVAAILLGREDDLSGARSALVERGAREAVAGIDQLGKTVPVEAVARGALSPLDVLPPARLPEELRQPLWSVPIEGAELFLKSKYQPEAMHLEDQFERGRYLNAMPFLAGGRLLVDDGQSVLAVEPDSGRLLWRQRIADEDVIPGNNFRYSNLTPGGLDLNCLAADSRRVVAICGFGAMATQYPFVEPPSSTWLTGLDAKTGKVIWSKKPEEVADDLMESFWFGRPIISEGRVYATIRRRQRTQFNDAYVLALDVNSGELIWRRHLAAVAIVGRNVVPGYVHPLLDHGWLYVDTRLGTVARLSALDGAVDWLTVLDGPMRAPSDGSARAFEATVPVLTRAGLVTLDPMTQSVRVLDPETGTTVDKFSAMDWNWPAYIVGLKGGDLLSVGQQVHRISGENPK
ncbi:MAG TPA: PQQ-binding-like beta-propeller repeat protein, partial [Nonomuraea sp.]|nr:PQQ-binding-like beta-propeller repeat protein [Nonomuraea sp.]